jgi:hypothetical protein
MTLYQVAEELSVVDQHFVRGTDGRRPINVGTWKFQEDPHWRYVVLLYEYFHGDNGAGFGAKPPDRMDRRHRSDDASVCDHHQ